MYPKKFCQIRTLVKHENARPRKMAADPGTTAEVAAVGRLSPGPAMDEATSYSSSPARELFALRRSSRTRSASALPTSAITSTSSTAISRDPPSRFPGGTPSAYDVLQAQPGNTVAGNAQVPAGASGAGAAPAAPPAPAPGAVTEQNRSLPLSLSQLSDLQKVPKRREIGARDDEQVGIPAREGANDSNSTAIMQSSVIETPSSGEVYQVSGPETRSLGCQG